MLYIGVCDDEQTICNTIEKELLSICNNLSIEADIEVFTSGSELLSCLENGAHFDIIFLDIMMQGVNGIQIGKTIRDDMHNESTKLVFISGKENYAMELFDIRPLNFLIKPIQFKKLEEVISKALLLINKENEFFEYRIKQISYKVRVSDIMYFESNGKKVSMMMVNKKEEFYGKLSDVYKQVGNQNFFFIHKSYLINYDHVIQYQYESMRMSNKEVLPISRKNRKDIREKIFGLKEREVQHGIR